MVKTMLRAAAAVAALAISASTFAQQAVATQPRVGLGVSMNTSLLTQSATLGGTVFAPPTNLYVPFYIAPNFRLEPQIGWIKVSDDADDTTDSSFALGIGALYVKKVTQGTDLYGGVRLISTWLKDEDRVSATVARKTTQRNTTLAAVFGGEYLPSPWFSVGVEAQIEYTAFGDPKVAQTGAPTVNGQGGSANATQGLLFMRLYFM